MVEDNDPFRAFEHATAELTSGKSGARTSYMHSLLRLAKTGATSLAAYLDANPSAESRTIVAAGLARLLKIESGEFEPHFSIQAFKVFDSVLAPVYKLRNVQPRDQTHVRRQAILDQLDEVTQPLTIYTSGDLEKEQVINARKAIERFSRHTGAALLVWPLIPDAQTIRGSAIESLQFLEKTLSSGRVSLDDIEHFKQLRTNHDVLVSRHQSSYYSEIIQPLLDSIYTGFDTLISRDPAFQPTTLELAFAVKRYPLDSLHTSINISAILTNRGPGRASSASVTYETTLSDTGTRTIAIGSVPAGNSTFDLPEVVEHTTTTEALIAATVEWTDVNGQHTSQEYNGTILAQRGNIDWTALRYSDPYSTEPVDSAGDLIGRSDQLGLMKSQYLGRVMPSYFITGQKRVGKTSLAKTLCQELNERDRPVRIHTIYLEGGDYIADDGPMTIKRLCQAIRSSIVAKFPTVAITVGDDFGDNLSDLKPFFDQLWAGDEHARILVALDEFDELPFELFTKGAQSRSVFLALRGLSGKPKLGFAIIGSEKMALIINEQGEHLNKWDNISLDYFDKRNQWSDYRELVVRPTHDKIDFSEDSILALYDLTAGHPFFTKLLCRRILDDACERRLSYIDATMVSRAAVMLADNEEGNRFQHFWEDGIFAPPEGRAATIERRKRVLLAAADLMRQGELVTVARLSDHRLLSAHAGEVGGELQSLERRKILHFTEHAYHFKIPLFKNWLTGVGSGKVLMELPTSDLVSILKKEQALRVSHAEIASLCEPWVYRWRKINPEDVRAWLEQFGTPADQRLMFTLIRHLRFYSGDVYRIKLQEAYRTLAHRYVRFREAGTIKRGDILVSYLDSPGKSGATLAKVFADENRIYVGNVVEQSKLAARIEVEQDLQAVICIDDFAGSGRTASTGLRRIWNDIGALVSERGIGFHFVAIAGFSAAVTHLQDAADHLHDKIFISVLDILTDQDRAFSADALIFDTEADRLRAREIAQGIGKTLTPSSALGHNGGEALVIFDTNCPNNTLPILWSKSKNWRPLFERV